MSDDDRPDPRDWYFETRRALMNARNALWTLSGDDGRPRDIRCPACDFLLLTAAPIFANAGELVDGETTPVVVGFRIVPAPGFVNVGRRHKTGVPFYHRARPDKTHVTLPAVKLPAVFECKCGKQWNIGKPPLGVLQQRLASGSREEKEKVLEDAAIALLRRRPRRGGGSAQGDR